jgi:hypothetical protein
MPTVNRLKMPPAATEMDELFYQLRLETWPRELRNWIRFDERYYRFLAISGSHRKALALASGLQEPLTDKLRRTRRQPSGLLESDKPAKPVVRGTRLKGRTSS